MKRNSHKAFLECCIHENRTKDRHQPSFTLPQLSLVQAHYTFAVAINIVVLKHIHTVLSLYPSTVRCYQGQWTWRCVMNDFQYSNAKMKPQHISLISRAQTCFSSARPSVLISFLKHTKTLYIWLRGKLFSVITGWAERRGGNGDSFPDTHVHGLTNTLSLIQCFSGSGINRDALIGQYPTDTCTQFISNVGNILMNHKSLCVQRKSWQNTLFILM